jgi:hypothetical protein
MVNYFRVSRKPLNFRVLTRIRTSILTELGDYADVDISVSALLSVVELHPEMFRWENNAVVKSESSERFFQADYVEQHFNWELDRSIRNRIVKAIISA